MIADLTKRHYEAIKKRGKITNKTKIIDFIEKMMEEDREMYIELIKYKTDPNNYEKMKSEIIDSTMTRINFLTHINIDLEMAILENVIKQENRKD